MFNYGLEKSCVRTELLGKEKGTVYLNDGEIIEGSIYRC